MRPQPARGTLSDAALPAMLQEPQLPAAWLLIFNWLIRPIWLRIMPASPPNGCFGHCEFFVFRMAACGHLSLDEHAGDLTETSGAKKGRHGDGVLQHFK